MEGGGGMTDLPSWADAAKKIEGVEVLDKPRWKDGEPCPDCGRVDEGCKHLEAEGELPGRIVCYDCWTVLHGGLEEGEEWVCKTCCHFDYPLVRRLP